MKLQPIYTNDDFEIVPFVAPMPKQWGNQPHQVTYESEPVYSVFKVSKLLFFFKERIRQKDFKTYEEAVAYIEFLTTTKWE